MPQKIIKAKKGRFYTRPNGAWVLSDNAEITDLMGETYDKLVRGRFINVGGDAEPNKRHFSKKSSKLDAKRRARKSYKSKRYPQSFDSK